MATRVKKNKLWTDEFEKNVIDFYSTQPCLWQNKNQKEDKLKRAGLLEVLRSRLDNIFTGMFKFSVCNSLWDEISALIRSKKWRKNV